jgi:hypothetical protein
MQKSVKIYPRPFREVIKQFTNEEELTSQRPPNSTKANMNRSPLKCEIRILKMERFAGISAKKSACSVPHPWCFSIAQILGESTSISFPPLWILKFSTGRTGKYNRSACLKDSTGARRSFENLSFVGCDKVG